MLVLMMFIFHTCHLEIRLVTPTNWFNICLVLLGVVLHILPGVLPRKLLKEHLYPGAERKTCGTCLAHVKAPIMADNCSHCCPVTEGVVTSYCFIGTIILITATKAELIIIVIISDLTCNLIG